MSATIGVSRKLELSASIWSHLHESSPFGCLADFITCSHRLCKSDFSLLTQNFSFHIFLSVAPCLRRPVCAACWGKTTECWCKQILLWQPVPRVYKAIMMQHPTVWTCDTALVHPSATLGAPLKSSASSTLVNRVSDAQSTERSQGRDIGCGSREHVSY